MFVLITFLTCLLIRSYDINRIQQIHNQAELKKLTALSQFCADLIQTNWRNNDSSIDKLISGLSHHKDVSNSYLTNHLAGILSPKSRALEIVNDSGIEQLLSDSEMSFLAINADSRVQVFQRIDIGKEVKGVLVIEKIIQDQTIKYFSLGFVLRIIMLCGIAILCSILLSRLWMKPWQTLYKEFDHALQTGEMTHADKHNNELVESHRVLYNRYLMKIKNQR